MSAYQAEGIEIDALVSELRSVDVSMWAQAATPSAAGASRPGIGSGGAALDIEGLLLLLEEESRLPSGSAKSWYEKAKRSNTNNTTTNGGVGTATPGAGGVPFPCISFPARKDVFVVKHFAGAVEYSPGLFLGESLVWGGANFFFNCQENPPRLLFRLCAPSQIPLLSLSLSLYLSFPLYIYFSPSLSAEKNTETLSRDARRCIGGSSSALVQAVFKPPPPPPSAAAAEASQPKSLFRGFRASLAALMQTIRSTDSHFVRCVKSNDASRPRFFDSQCVHKQLLYCGIFDTIKVCPFCPPISPSAIFRGDFFLVRTFSLTFFSPLHPPLPAQIQQAGLPCRLPHAAFLARYLCAVPSDVR